MYAKKVTSFKELKEGSYDFKVVDFQICVSALCPKEDKTFLSQRFDGSVKEAKSDKLGWWVKLIGSVDVGKPQKYNINLYPNEKVDVDNLMFNLIDMYKQLNVELEDADVFDLIEDVVGKTFTIWLTETINNDKTYMNVNFRAPKEYTFI